MLSAHQAAVFATHYSLQAEDRGTGIEEKPDPY